MTEVSIDVGSPAVALIISPHLDDAVFSCGIGIRVLTRLGWSVVTATVFTAAPEGPVSSIARRFNSNGDGDVLSGLAARRAEDVAALTLLGSEVRHLGFYDGSLRKRPDGSWLCRTFDDILRTRPTAEPELRGAITQAILDQQRQTGASLIIAPGGVGAHVDHLLVHAAARDVGYGIDIRYFEDLPYAIDHPPPKSQDFCRATRADFEIKIEALSCYASQTHSSDDPVSWRLLQTRLYDHAYRADDEAFIERVILAPDPIARPAP